MSESPLALSVHDLRVIESGHAKADLRIHDLRLAERLEFKAPRQIREMIERNRLELERYGELPSSSYRATRSGKIGVEFWLNEAQALLICMKSETSRAADVRQEIITVFLAWRHRILVPANQAPMTTELLQGLFAPLAKDVGHIITRFDFFETKLDNILEINARRTEPIAEHKRFHVKVIKHFNFGNCPCGDKDCHRIILGDDGQLGKRGLDWEYHHQINRWSSGLKETIPLAKDCHKRITTSSEERNRFGAVGFLRWIENIEKMQQRPPERIATQQNDIEFFKKAKQKKFDFE